jgi:hypothetical protein
MFSLSADAHNGNNLENSTLCNITADSFKENGCGEKFP